MGYFPYSPRIFRVHAPLVVAELRFEEAGEPVERKRTRGPPAAVDRGVDHEGKDCEGEEVRESVGGPPGSLTGDDACVARVVFDRWRRNFTEEDGVRTAEAPTRAP